MMSDILLMGDGHRTWPIPWSIWQRQVRGDTNLDFMTENHHKVRNFVVIEIPKQGMALSSETIAQALAIPLIDVSKILVELEENMTFLYRDEQGAVTWAYPVTVDETPHRMAFSSGERINAA